MGRLIDADALIEKCGDYYVEEGPEEGFIGTLKALVDTVPTVNPEPNDGWVLCSEKMPEEHEWIGTKKFGTTISDEVYVTFEDSEGERFTKHLQFQNGELSRYDEAFMDAWHKGAKPITWKPLPEAYRGER